MKLYSPTITEDMMKDLEKAKAEETAWFTLHGFPYYSTTLPSGRAHPAHAAWVATCEADPDRRAIHSPMARRMFVLGWLKKSEY